MRITRLRLTDFKTHEDLELRPADGLTVVRGPNEAGKSTVQQALELALYRKADTNREDVRRAWSWGASEPPTVELDFEVDGAAGTLRKRFAGSRSEAELTFDGQTITDYTLIGDRLADLTGVPTEAFFRATASVGHAELDAVSGKEPAIGDRLQKAISGADRGTARAKKKLEAAIHRYRTQGHKNPGLLKVARAEAERLERELAEGESALSQLQADRAAWVEASDRRDELERKLTRVQADLSEAKRAEELARRRDAAQDRYDRLKRAAELTEEQGELRRGLPTSMSPEQLRASVAHAQGLELELSELQAEIDSAVEAAAGAGPEIVPPRPMRWLAAGAALVLVGWLAMFLLRDAGVLAFVIVAALAAGVVLTLVQAFRMARKRRLYGLAMQLAEAEIRAHQEHARDREEAYRRKRRELDNVLEAIGADDVRGAEGLLQSTEQQAEALARIEGELAGLGVDERNIRRLEEARDQAAGEAAQAAHALAAMGSLGEDPASARAEAERELAMTAPARDAARSEADQAEGRVGANVVDAELVASLAERLAAARERLSELERRARVYQGTLAAIDAAETATLKTAARYLEERMGPAIAEITDGRYDDIEVDEKSLAFRVRAPETGELVDVAELSQGTADQLFLAARLGLVRLVTLDRQPPL
ncbi:MAG: AAA family ATPase, partial [Candidatus Limnocylindrales bacterium]